MKKVILSSVVGLVLLSSLSYAKQVTVCSSYLVGATAEMECSGGATGKFTISQLYQKGWRYAGDISGASHKFILIFEK
jgi:hypothetical protein